MIIGGEIKRSQVLLPPSTPLPRFLSRKSIYASLKSGGRGEDWKRDEILATEGSVIRLLQD